MAYNFEQEEFSINNGGTGQNFGLAGKLPSVVNGVDYNIAQSNSVKIVKKINKIYAHKVAIEGEPDSVTQKIRGDYDEEGAAYLDIDYKSHGNPRAHPVAPHEHAIELGNGR